MIRQVNAFQGGSVAIVSVCGFDICHIQRLQDQPALPVSEPGHVLLCEH